MTTDYPIWCGPKSRIDDAREAGLDYFAWSQRDGVAEVELVGALSTSTLMEFAACLDLARESSDVGYVTIDLCVSAANCNGVAHAVKSMRDFCEQKQIVCHAVGYAVGGGYLLWLAASDRTCTGLTKVGDLRCTFDGQTWPPSRGVLPTLAEHQVDLAELAMAVNVDIDHSAILDRAATAEEAEARGIADVLWDPQPGVAAKLLRQAHAKKK